MTHFWLLSFFTNLLVWLASVVLSADRLIPFWEIACFHHTCSLVAGPFQIVLGMSRLGLPLKESSSWQLDGFFSPGVIPSALPIEAAS